MGYKLYLDDERTPSGYDSDFVLARTIYEAIDIVEERGLPEFISFDYYLDNHHTGLDFAMWLVTYCESEKLELDFTYKCHSSDRYAAKKLIQFLDEHVKRLQESLVKEDK